ncbi:hypothetical protein IWQ56_003350 [Coemansia nantahalensis]|nr:hypothetical protein IWQ56_003350 [Coemansia nantahalensis]
MASSRPDPVRSGPGKRRRLDARDDQARARVECILREQLELELYLKQKEISAISTRLHHSEALLAVIESAIQAQCHTELSHDDAADGLAGYFRRLRVAAATEHDLADLRQLGRPRRAAVAAAHARYTARGYETAPWPDTDSEGAGSAPAAAEFGRSSRRRTPAQTPHLDMLSGRLDAEQMSSVADALEFIRARRGSGAESSTPSSSSDESFDDTAGAARAQKPGEPSKGTSILVQPSRESRFHVLRRVLLGNTSQFVAPQDRPPGMESSTHQWTVYLRGASAGDAPGDYIRKVRVFLHPSYRPDDIVDLEPPNLELTRWGWGEFPVRVQVFFLDRRNKPVDLIHMLKLDNRSMGSETAAAETPVDFELDRRWFEGGNRAAAIAAQALSHHKAANPILGALFGPLCALYPLVLDDALPRGSQRPGDPVAAFDKLPNTALNKWTWGVAASADVWHTAWPLGRRLASEGSRTRALLRLLATASKELEETEGNPAGEASRAKATLLCWAAEYRDARPLCPDRARAEPQRQHVPSLRRWLRSYGHVPQPMLSASERLACMPALATDDSSEHLPAPAQGAGPGSEGAGQNNADAAQAVSPWDKNLRLCVFCHACGAMVRHTANESVLTGRTTDGRYAARTSQIAYCCAGCESAGKSVLSTTTPVAKALSALPNGWDEPDDGDGEGGGMDAVVAVDNDPTPCPASSSMAVCAPRCLTTRISGLAAALREYYLVERRQRGTTPRHDSLPVGQDGYYDAGDARVSKEASADEAIDWIWSTIRPLELNCATACRLAIADGDSSDAALRDGGPTCPIWLPNGSNEACEEALDQRVIVGQLLLDSAKLFLRDLIAASDKVLRANRAACVNGARDAAHAASDSQLLMLTPLHVLAAVKQDPQAFDVCSNAYLARDGSS